MAYIHETFMPQTLQAAKQVALSGDPSDPEKFERETQFLMDFIRSHKLISRKTAVLDFGCGMGRVSKALINSFGCRVEGSDISEHMRAFAMPYVNDSRFSAVATPHALSDVVLVSFVLQHVEHPKAEIETIANYVRTGGILLLVNEKKRFVPSAVNAQGYVVWHDDQLDIPGLLSKYFTKIGEYDYYRRTDKPLSLWTRNT